MRKRGVEMVAVANPWPMAYGHAAMGLLATRKGKILERFATMPTTAAIRGLVARRKPNCDPQMMPLKTNIYTEEKIYE